MLTSLFVRPVGRAALPPLLLAIAAFSVEAQDIRAQYGPTADRIITAALSDSSGYHRLGELVDTFGHRFSGSASLERAIDWILTGMRRDGLENVRGEPVMVPRWVRGSESATLVRPRRQKLHMLGLGGSIGTPADGITASLLVVTSFEELKERAALAQGKIVLFDVPFTTYGETVRYRTTGAIEAARAGAVAVLIRSVATASLQTPHTGAMRYDSTVRKIPAAALSTEDAGLLRRMHDRGERVVVTLQMSARTLPDVRSRNVVAEFRGRERPDEVVVVGGHIDSWDVGQGAVDDAGGSVAAWEAVRLLQHLGLRPRRTIRVVLWTNEENGLRGATAYRDRHAAELDRHVLAIESDGGVFNPQGFSVAGSEATVAAIAEIASLLSRVGATNVRAGGAGADVGPLTERGVPGAGLVVDGTQYFWYHHSEADTFDKIDAAEFARCVAALAVLAYVAAEMPDPLPRGAAIGNQLTQSGGRWRGVREFR
jgi:carboxypeptidase Q